MALMIPNCPGAVFDLWNNDSMTNILEHFVSEKSKLTFICVSVLLYKYVNSSTTYSIIYSVELLCCSYYLQMCFPVASIIAQFD